MKHRAKLLTSSIVIIILLFSSCKKDSFIKTDNTMSSFSFKNKSIGKLNSDEILKYSINNNAPTLLTFDNQVQLNLIKDFNNNKMNLKIWVENTNGQIISNENILINSKEMYLKYNTISLYLSRNLNLNLLHSTNNKIIIDSHYP